MLFVTDTISNKEVQEANQFLNEFDEVTVTTEETSKEASSVTKYLHSLVTSCYQKSVEEIADTKVGNKFIRKRNLQQVMQESFFLGANRFGNNFIA